MMLVSIIRIVLLGNQCYDLGESLESYRSTSLIRPYLVGHIGAAHK